MKKNYMKPTTKAVCIAVEQSLLAGSDGAFSVKGDYEEGVNYDLARQNDFSVWDFDEE